MLLQKIIDLDNLSKIKRIFQKRFKFLFQFFNSDKVSIF